MFLSFRANTYLASVINMREKVIKGWVLGENGMYRVNPKWTSVEETLLQTTLEGLGNTEKEEMGALVGEGEELGIVDIGKPAMKKAGLVEDVRPDEKKKKFGTLGPRGLRKNGGYNYGGLSAPNYSGDGPKVEGWALVEKNMKQEGYGIFPKDFTSSFKSKKTFQFVDQDFLTVTVDGLELASACREEPKFDSFNPFSQEVPFGERLPRYIF